MGKLSILLVAALAGCDDDLVDPTDENEDTGDTGDEPPQPPRELQATLIPLEPSTLSGAAVVTSYPGEQAFTATITLRGDAPGSLRPWHVHVGVCDSSGSIVGPDAAYPRLPINSDGFASVTTNVLVALDAGAYHVNVHHSDAELSRLIACGDLIRQ